MTDEENPKIPSYKPLVMRKKRLPAKEKTYPYLEGKHIFIGVDGEWELCINTGYHPNLVVAKIMCKDQLPTAVESLYHPVVQLRMALGIDVSSLVNLAESRWDWFWYTRDLV